MAKNSNQNDNLFKKLTTLFRSGPIVKRKVKSRNTNKASVTSMEVFKRAHSDVYNSTLSAYGSYDRMARYSDFSEMEATPEISSALDIYAEESVSPDASGSIMSIYSDNRKVKELLDNLFYDIINIDFNMVMWVRNLCKYGDFFLFNDVSPELGIVAVYPIPISEMEREEGFDPEDPSAVRFRWVTQGNRVLENWQVSHFRLLGNDAFLPYGSSVLEGARRIWRQLILIEDAMLVYRVIRSPERRVFYIDVGNIPPENVADYLEQAQTSLKRNAVVDKTTGQVDLRYNPLSVDEDYFLPVRGGDSGTKIDTLAGGSNTTAIEDVEYIQKKLFAALKIPKAYLGYDEDIGAKATLAQEDIRFSRSIQRIQKTLIAELNKIAIIHLYTHGFEGDDLLNFELRLSNPSSIAQQQKLELVKSKFDIASSAPDGLVDREWIRKTVLDLSDDEIKRIEYGKKLDRLADMALERVQLPEDSGDEGSEEASDLGSDSDLGSGGGLGGDDGGGLGGGLGGGGLGDLFSADYKEGDLLDEDDDPKEDNSPIKATLNPKNPKNKKSRGKYKTNPEIKSGIVVAQGPNSKALSVSAKESVPSLKDIFGNLNSVEESSNSGDKPHITNDIAKAISGLKNNIVINKKSAILSENINEISIDDIIVEDDD